LYYSNVNIISIHSSGEPSQFCASFPFHQYSSVINAATESGSCCVTFANPIQHGNKLYNSFDEANRKETTNRLAVSLTQMRVSFVGFLCRSINASLLMIARPVVFF